MAFTSKRFLAWADSSALPQVLKVTYNDGAG
jgi:hypothetical protein